ncbi:AraC family transcriptional regulator [Paenibacillus doosanensis]|uniref:HTH-type transcriptional regulator YesS n=1 Tax=Paenibacillus konkukensis TaxID=2020716 RepID=A0ABY4RL56_9BACL|nr:MULTISPECIES: AraC family transcriptional regulator [Paenibacillus]MCS7462418.1 AraC family transcriptional regulator [Paenibacillus doosanensis]UQZ83199.1 HTH-type transcriptional regulator YesS [Paenibacillus konkukensis]
MNGWKLPFHMPAISWVQRRTYRKSLLIVLAITCLPTLLVGICVNRIGIGQLEKSVAATRELQVSQAVVRADELLTHLEKNATQWAFNPVFGLKLLNLQTDYDYEHIREIFHSLVLLKGSNPLIQEAYLYMDRPGTVYSEDGGVTALGALDRERFHSLLAGPYTTYWLPSLGLLQQMDKEAPALIYRLPADIGQPFAALAIYLNKGALAQLLSEPTAGGEASSFMVAADGVWIAEAGSGQPSAREEELKRAVLSQGRRSGTFVYAAANGKESYSVSYSTLNRLGSGWIYVSAVSLSKMTAPVLLTSRLLYAVSLAGLLAGIVISIFASRKLYEPIRYLTGLIRVNRRPADADGEHNEVAFIEREWRQLSLESQSLRELSARQLPSLRVGFLLQLVQGHFYTWTETEVRSRMEELGWEPGDDSFAVVVIQLHGMTKRSSAHYKERDIQHLSYAASNITEELAQSKFDHAEVINFQDMSAGLLVRYPARVSSRQAKLELYEFAEQLTQAISSTIRMEVTVCLGRITPAATRIPVVLDEARQEIRNRKLIEGNQILDAEEHSREEHAPVHYPFVAETELHQAIRDGQLDEAMEAAERFCRELHRHRSTQRLFSQGLLQLFGNMQFHFLKAGFDPYPHAASFDPYAELSRITDPEEAVGWFRHKVVGPYVEEVRQTAETHEAKHRRIVESMVESLRTSYHSEVSLESYADAYGVNPVTLSRIFRQATGSNFIDCLTRIRMDQSKRLLAETDLKINEIAERVGYQPTYFNRIFKKIEGVTPSRYREAVKL